MEISLERTGKKQCGPWAELFIADGGIEGRRWPDFAGRGSYSHYVPPADDFGCCPGLGRSTRSPAVGRPQDARCGSAWPAVAWCGDPVVVWRC
jgi:hypothetical protein